MFRMTDDISIQANMELFLLERGKIVPGSRRVGHNVFTTFGKNWLTKLMSWQTISAPDVPFTNRRMRWVSLGTGSQLEVETVTQLSSAILTYGVNYLAALDAVEFPTSKSARFIKTFGLSEISITSTPVSITEAGLFADVVPANAGGTEDNGYSGPTDPTLNPGVANNPPVAYKAFEPVTKTQDLLLEVRWDLRFV